jgi:hypothetical protein
MLAACQPSQKAATAGPRLPAAKGGLEARGPRGAPFAMHALQRRETVLLCPAHDRGNIANFFGKVKFLVHFAAPTPSARCALAVGARRLYPGARLSLSPLPTYSRHSRPMPWTCGVQGTIIYLSFGR